MSQEGLHFSNLVRADLFLLRAVIYKPSRPIRIVLATHFWGRDPWFEKHCTTPLLPQFLKQASECRRFTACKLISENLLDQSLAQLAKKLFNETDIVISQVKLG